MEHFTFGVGAWLRLVLYGIALFGMSSDCRSLRRYKSDQRLGAKLD